MNESTNYPAINHLTNQPTNQSTTEPYNQTTNEPTNQTASPPTNQVTNKKKTFLKSQSFNISYVTACR
jgi:hypothetical protein